MNTAQARVEAFLLQSLRLSVVHQVLLEVWREAEANNQTVASIALDTLASKAGVAWIDAYRAVVSLASGEIGSQSVSEGPCRTRFPVWHIIQWEDRLIGDRMRPYKIWFEAQTLGPGWDVR